MSLPVSFIFKYSNATLILNPIHFRSLSMYNFGQFFPVRSPCRTIVLPNKIPKKELSIGLGRNCTLFEIGRYFAYSEVLSFKITSNKDCFYNAVLNYLEQHNRSFPVPLQFSEYKAIAKSISNWTWKHYGNKSGKDWIYYVKKTHSVELQSWRGKQNTPEQQAIKGKKNTSEQQAIKGRLGGLANTSEQQSIKGKLNTSEQQSLKGKQNTSEQNIISLMDEVVCHGLSLKLSFLCKDNSHMKYRT